MAIPLWRTDAGNFTTAWYAVTMVPKGIVAGQGVRIWVQFPLLLTLMVLLAVWLWQHWPLLIQALLLLTIVVFWYISTSLYVRKMAKKVPGVGRAWARVTYGLLAIAGVFIGASAAQLTESGGWDATSFAILFFGNFLAGLPMAILVDPPLPRVEIRLKEERPKEDIDQVSNYCVGRLVAHTDGFWHLFVENQERLLSIPDDRVIAVRTFDR